MMTPIIAPGTPPMERRHNTDHCTVRFCMCVSIATIFVPSAKSRSEPIAVSVPTPRKISSGVVIAPAPTPLYDMQTPTMKPTRTKLQLMCIRRVLPRCARENPSQYSTPPGRVPMDHETNFRTLGWLMCEPIAEAPFIRGPHRRLYLFAQLDFLPA